MISRFFKTARKIATMPVVFSLGIIGCSENATDLSKSNKDENALLDSALTFLVDSLLNENPGIKNATFLVDIPVRNFKWEKAWGIANPLSMEAMTPGHAFRTTSTTKLFTSATVLCLVEKGLISLNDTLGKYFAGDSLVDFLHVYGGVSYGPGITIRQLLNHTSGLADYFLELDENKNGTPDMVEAIFTDQDNKWSPRSLLDLTAKKLSPHFPPGQGFFYSDGNYLLLGLIVEKITGMKLHQAYFEMIYKPLNIADTWLEWHEQPKTNVKISHSFIEGIDITDMNTRFDWGGGGLFSTNKSLNRFIRGLLTGELIKNTKLMDELLTWTSVPDMPPGTWYGLGIFKAYGSAGLLGHSGSLGSIMYYWPDMDATICGTINSFDVSLEPDFVLGILEKIVDFSPSNK